MLRHTIFRYGTLPGLGSSAEGLPRTGYTTLDRLRRRDITLRIPSRDGLLRVCFCSSAMLLFETIWRHRVRMTEPANLPFLELMGTHLSFTNLLASLQEGEERVACRFAAREATIVAEALALGECRCCLRTDPDHAAVESPAGGFPLKVDRILYNETKPFTSVVNADLKKLRGCEIIPQLMNTQSSAQMNSLDEIIGLLKKGDLEPSSLRIPSSPPLGLTGMQSIDSDALEAFFAYNISLHGYNLFRQSDGSSAVVFARSFLLKQRIEELNEALRSEGSDDEALTPAHHLAVNEKSNARWLDILPSVIPLSFGVLVQPLASGNTFEWQLWRLQSALMRASAALMAPEIGTNNSHHDVLVLKPLLDRCAETYTTCQYMLSLITGDYKGAHAASERGRQYTHPIEVVTEMVEPIRSALDINDVFIELEASAAVRTGLDFFCRCSTANLLQTLVNVPEDTLRELMTTNDFRCTYCGKVLCPTPEEWNQLMERRAKRA